MVFSPDWTAVHGLTDVVFISRLFLFYRFLQKHYILHMEGGDVFHSASPSTSGTSICMYIFRMLMIKEQKYFS